MKQWLADTCFLSDLEMAECKQRGAGAARHGRPVVAPTGTSMGKCGAVAGDGGAQGASNGTSPAVMVK